MYTLSELEKNIINLIKKTKKNLNKQEIKKALNIKSSVELEELNNALQNLELNGLLYLNNYCEYQLFQKRQELSLAEIKCNSKNEAYVILGSNQVKIHSSFLNGAIPGDLVVVRKNDYDGKSVCVDKILKRTKPNMIFDYINGELQPYRWPNNIEINLPPNQMKKLINGSRILVNVSLDKVGNKYNGQLVSIVGYKDDPELDVKTIVTNHGIIIDFENEVSKEAEALPRYVSKKEIKKRLANGGIDLRNKTIFTIDGENTKDIDDAISIDILKNGNFLLGVHIADVSYYVKEGTVLDEAARKRSTSVYPYNYVIPMLPHILSNGICSLNPNETRMAFSCFMEIDKQGNICNYKFIDSVIESKKKMSYEIINDIFENQADYEDYRPFLYDLALLGELAEILNINKLKRGYISFGDKEVAFDDNNGEVIGVRRRHRGVSQKWIENFMLAANECAANYTYWQNIPAIYRVHPTPDSAKIEAIIQLFNLNINVPNNIEDPRILQNILAKIKKYDGTEVYTDLLLQAMKRASYSPNNIGHFGLALDCYTHFTSPIRRYPDLETHRTIRQVCYLEKCSDYKDRIQCLNDDQFEKLQQICENASRQERIADKIERAVEHYKLAEYMEKHIGETFTACINFVSHNGLSVLTNELIQGKIPVDDLIEKGYYYDDTKKKYVNSDGSELFLGDSISIIAKSANKETFKIEFAFDKKLVKQKIKVS